MVTPARTSAERPKRHSVSCAAFRKLRTRSRKNCEHPLVELGGIETRKSVRGGSVHVATTSVLSISELVDQNCQIMRIPIEALVDVVEDCMGKDDAYLSSTTQLRAGLGWSGRIALQEGLTVTFGWIEDNLSVLERLSLGCQHRP